MNNKRIIAKDVYVNNNSYETQLNNNDLVVAVSGAGKTRSYVLPNILQANESMVITDTKNSLYQKTAGYLQNQGYVVHKIDFTGNTPSTIGYNPLDYIRYNAKKDQYMNQDILKLSRIIVPPGIKDPFWNDAAFMLCASMLSCVMNETDTNSHNMQSVQKLIRSSKNNNYARLMKELERKDSNNEASMLFSTIMAAGDAEKMIGSIYGVLANYVLAVNTESVRNLSLKDRRIWFPELGERKTALFINVSDSDRSSDAILSIFYSQALQSLITKADLSMDGRLHVPVRFIFDDFASGAPIHNFDKIISVIRSREIYASVIIQSFSQLSTIYSKEQAKTIMDNCDSVLYLGGSDYDTIEMISHKSNKMVKSIVTLPIEQCLYFQRGAEPITVERYDITQHPFYNKLNSPIRFNEEDYNETDGTYEYHSPQSYEKIQLFAN